MKRFLFAVFLLVGCAHADELPLDHSFGASPSPQALAFSPDGKKLAVAGSDGVKVYESGTGSVLESYPGSRMSTVSVAWSPDGLALAAGGLTLAQAGGGEIRVWRSGEKPLVWTAGEGTIESLAWSPDGRILASAVGEGFGNEDSRGRACLWDATNGKLVKDLGHYVSYLASIAFSDDGKTVGYSYADTNGDGQTVLCDAVTGNVLKTWKETASPLRLKGQAPVFKQSSLAWRQEDDLEWSVGSLPGDVPHYGLVARKTGGTANLISVDLGPGGTSAALSSACGAVLTRQSPDPNEKATVAVWRIGGNPPRAQKLYEVGTRTISATQLAISGDGKTLGLVSTRGTGVFGSDFSHLRLLPSSGPQTSSFFDPLLSFSGDGKRLYNGHWLDLTANPPRPIVTLGDAKEHGDGQVALSPDGQVLVGPFSASFNTALRVGTKAALELKVPDGPGEKRPIRFESAAWSSDSKWLAIIGHVNTEGQLFLFDGQGKFKTRVPPVQRRPQWSAVSFSPDGKSLVGAGIVESRTGPRESSQVVLQLLDPATGALQRQIRVGSGVQSPMGGGQITAVAFSPDSQIIAAGGFGFIGGVYGANLLFFNAAKGTSMGSLPLVAATEKAWVFLDSEHVAILNGNAIDVWDFKAHKKEKSVFMVPQKNGFEFVEIP